MTICVAIKVHEGLIFAADSATSLTSAGPDGREIIHNTYSHGNKVFNLMRGCPVVAMTSGMGNIGRQSISGISKDMRRRFAQEGGACSIDGNNYSIEEVATKARRILYEELYLGLEEDLKPSGPHILDYWIGGFGTSDPLAELWKVTILNGDCEAPELILDANSCDIAWGGQPEAINRLLLGFGQQLPGILKHAGISDADLPVLMSMITQQSAAPILSPAMPIQDAIYLGEFLVYTTKMYVKFCMGAETVGGDTDIAAVTRHEGFKWVSRKHYYKAEYNRETDHV